jgi:hypothetical protein
LDAPAEILAALALASLARISIITANVAAMIPFIYTLSAVATLNPSDRTSISLMAKRSNYQDRVIRNYYQNRDDIMLQRLGELVTDLFLAEGKTKTRVWKRVAEILEKLKVPKSEIERLVRSDNPTLVANVLKKLLEKL